MPAFTLRIELGNERMQTPDDVAGALRRIAGSLAVWSDWPGMENTLIHDADGNTVGRWEFVSGSEDEGATLEQEQAP